MQGAKPPTRNIKERFFFISIFFHVLICSDRHEWNIISISFHSQRRIRNFKDIFWQIFDLELVNTSLIALFLRYLSKFIGLGIFFFPSLPVPLIISLSRVRLASGICISKQAFHFSLLDIFVQNASEILENVHYRHFFWPADLILPNRAPPWIFNLVSKTFTKGEQFMIIIERRKYKFAICSSQTINFLKYLYVILYKLPQIFHLQLLIVNLGFKWVTESMK